ncbi:shikimate dehydrogenase [Mucilaginibacter robiniae]|uniref:Shikimate dehydrogenase n=1 Tax=Mucilaginibacter robiniae TaxID=2728022 RepID=A0A7L5DXT3_9SPHI|nr:shikimate dehydrogenase [Mucilaginibacter robiniae]QJD95910.1 shikimate dehydrogenase [Mucilaginibacter robiniae]
MKKYGLIGYPLSHSFSQRYFEEKFAKEGITDAEYKLYPLQSVQDFQDLLHQNPDLCGLNVTVPYKIDILEEMDWMSEYAKGIGAVNCIRISSESPVLAAFSGEVGLAGHDFRLEGFNTDAYGFEMSLKPLLKSHHEQALILGDGGAARAVKYVLSDMSIPYKIVTRKAFETSTLFEQLTPQDIEEHTLIINTTPVGMSPDIEAYPPIPYEYINSDHLLYDLIYNPEETAFLRKGREMGAATKNGHEMLILQAEKSWEIWNSKAKHP